MPARIRGREATIRIAVADETGIMVPQDGSFFKVKDFRSTPRIDQVEEDFIGEVASDLDQMFHGYDGSFSIHMQDRKALDFLSQIVEAEETQVEQPDIVVMVEYRFRDGQLPVREVFSELVMKVSEHAIPGRKEYITTSFEFKSKVREQIFV